MSRTITMLLFAVLPFVGAAVTVEQRTTGYCVYCW